MKKKGEQPEGSEVAREYDFSRGVQGKYAARFADGSNIVVLDADVSEVFSDGQAVNEALRILARSIR